MVEGNTSTQTHKHTDTHTHTHLHTHTHTHTSSSSKLPLFKRFSGIQSILFLEQTCYISLRFTSSRNSSTLIAATKTATLY